MQLNEAVWRERLDSIRPIAVKSIWVSATPFCELCKNHPPDWLFTSCKPARYNPKGVACVYLAQDGRTARAELACNGENEHQPIVFYSVEVSLRRVLDLTDAKTLKTLKIERVQLFEEWERQKSSATQLVGAAVASHPSISAIRFPSAAAKEAGFKAHNIVIFRESIRSHDSVKVVGPAKKPLQRWP